MAQTLYGFFLALIGASIGSFLHTLATHWHGNVRSWCYRRSACHHCAVTLSVVDLIPIASWIGLRGRCRHCGGTIGWGHAAAEFGAALALVVPLLYWAHPTAIFFAAAGLVLLLLALIDQTHGRLPHGLTLSFGALGLIKQMTVLGLSSTLHALIAAVAIWALLQGFRWLYLQLRKRDGLGGGDIMLIAAGTCWLALTDVAHAIILAGSLGIAATLFARGWRGLDQPFPLGPYLAIGLWSVMLFAERY